MSDKTWETTGWMVTGFAGIPMIDTIGHTRRDAIRKAERFVMPTNNEPPFTWGQLRKDGYRAVKVVVTWSVPDDR